MKNCNCNYSKVSTKRNYSEYDEKNKKSKGHFIHLPTVNFYSDQVTELDEIDSYFFLLPRNRSPSIMSKKYHVNGNLENVDYFSAKFEQNQVETLYSLPKEINNANLLDE